MKFIGYSHQNLVRGAPVGRQNWSRNWSKIGPKRVVYGVGVLYNDEVRGTNNRAALVPASDLGSAH